MTFPEALSAVSDVIRRHVGRVMRATSRRLAVARDELEQAARIGVWRAWRTFDAARASWRTWAGHWIVAYVEREAWGEVSRRRGAKAQGILSSVALDDVVLVARESSPEDRATAREALALARRELMRPPGRRSVMDTRRAVRAWLSGDSLRDVARRQGVTVQAVSLQVRARVEAARAAVEAA